MTRPVSSAGSQLFEKVKAQPAFFLTWTMGRFPPSPSLAIWTLVDDDSNDKKIESFEWKLANLNLVVPILTLLSPRVMSVLEFMVAFRLLGSVPVANETIEYSDEIGPLTIKLLVMKSCLNCDKVS